ncbi:MAG: type II toxin-antitoxin system PemK/MazF family toxin [Bryobacteraceae bacterium]
MDQIRAISKERLDGRLGTLSAEHLKVVEDGIHHVLDLN